MTPIEKQFQEAIQLHSRVAHDYVLDSSDAAEACYAIHKSECIKFAEWIEKNHYWKSTDTRFPQTLGRWNDRINGNVLLEQSYTSEELFEIYQQSKEI